MSVALARILGATGVLGVGVLLAGCKGFPTQGERQAREQVKAVTASYRPQGHKPALPVLTADSGLSNFLAYAFLNHPVVEAAYYDWIAAVERITTARSLPDPQFTFQMDVQNVVTSVMPGLMGTFPWPSKLRVAAEVASAESRGRYFAFQSAVLQSAYEVKRAYYQLYYVAEKIRVSQETLALLSDLEQLARAQNEVGKVTLQDVLRAQIEQDRLRNELAHLEHSRGALLAQFKAALGMKTEESDPPVPQHLESTTLELSSDQLLEEILRQNQRLKSLGAEVSAAESSIALARTARYPDFGLGFMADVKANPTLYRFPGNPGTVSLPLWRDKIAAQIAGAQANRHSAQARQAAEELALAVSFAEKTLLYHEATLNLALLKEQLLPKATRSLEVARSGYLTGQIDFFNLTDSERALLSFRLEQVEAELQRETVLTELSLMAAGMSPVEGSIGVKTASLSSSGSSAGPKSMKPGGM